MLEREVEKRCRKIAIEAGCLFIKWTAPGTIGVHDRLLIVSETDDQDGRIIPIEIKTEKGKLTPKQESFHQTLWDMGVPNYTVHSPEEFDDLLMSVLEGCNIGSAKLGKPS